MLLEGLLYRERPPVDVWCERNLQLPKETSPNAPGPLSFDRMNYMREPLNCLLDPKIEHVYTVWGAQIGKTVLDLCAFAWLKTFEPNNMLWALPTDKICKSFSSSRFQAFVKKNPVLCEGEHLTAESFTTMEMRFREMMFYFTGVNSPANLSQRPIPYVIMDEAAKFEHVRKHEAHPASLIEDRTLSFPRSLVIHSSTPNVEDEPFWQGFLGTDMRKFYVPCPHCGTMMTFEFSRETVVWDRGPGGGPPDLNVVEESARYVCQACGGAIDNRQKEEMIRQGEWRPENPTAHASRRGYHLNSLYSPFLSFGQIARMFVTASREKLSFKELQNFYNSVLARPHHSYSIKVDDEAPGKLMTPGFRRGDPKACDSPHYCVATYDCHQHKQYWMVCLVGRGGEIWALDWGTILSIKTDAARGVEGISEHFRTLRYGGISPHLGIIDSGYATKDVYDECLLLPGKLWPSKGNDATQGSWTVGDIVSHPGLRLYTYVDYQAKIELYGSRIAKGAAPRIYLPIDADEELLRGLSGQRLEKKPGARREVWKNLADDHYGDCLKLAQLSWWVLGMELEPPPSSPERSVE